MPPSPKIAILGAGPAGLTLASLLTKNSIPYTVFDLRSRPPPEAISQPSGSLDLHAESGLLALKSCGLLEKFSQLEAECGEEMIVADMHGVVRHQDDGDGNRPEIARNALTQLLLDSVPEENINWEKKVASVAPSTSATGTWKLSFHPNSKGHGQDEEFDLVIGADGAWSKIRPAITDVKPYFSGVNCITLTIPHLNTTHPSLASLVGKGTYSACNATKAVMAQRGSLESARIYLMIKSPESCSSPESYLHDSGLDACTPEQLKAKLLSSPELFAFWGEELKQLVATGCEAESASLGPDGRIEMRPLYMLPPGHTWEHKAGLTLVGDAAHLMTPFAGEGVNAAMLDALQLAQEIIKVSSSLDGAALALDQAAQTYEEGMFPRAKEIMEETFQNMNMIFSEDSPKAFVEFFQQAYGPPAEE